MRVLLINPHDAAQNGFSSAPLGLAYLAGTLQSHGLEVAIIDGFLAGLKGIQDKVREYEPDIAGITSYTPGFHSALEIASWIKRYRARTLVVLGGPHATIMWKQILATWPEVDLCVLGEGEQTLLELAQGRPFTDISGIAFRDDSKPTRSPYRQQVENLDSIPFPAWNLLPLGQYPASGLGTFNGVNIAKEPRIPVVFSRGCTGSCVFCSTWWIWRGHRCRSARNMADEIELLSKRYGVKSVWFADDAFSVNMDSAKELCREIVARDLRIAWFATTRVDAIDRELLLAMKEAGCYAISYGVETGSQPLLDLMGKTASVKAATDAIVATRKAGLRAVALMITGNKGETDETINQTVDFLKEAKPTSIGSVGGLWLLPGTALYQEVKRRGLIDDSYWLTDRPTPVYLAEHDAEELRRYTFALAYRTKVHTRWFWLLWSLYRMAKALQHGARTVSARILETTRVAGPVHPGSGRYHASQLRSVWQRASDTTGDKPTGTA